MSGFSFPPPPPPPLKAKPATAPYPASQRGGHDRGRGRGTRDATTQRGRGQSGQRGLHAQNGHTRRDPKQIHGQPSLTHGTSEFGNSDSYFAQASWTPQSNGYLQAGSPPRTTAGHKRKLDALRGPPPIKPEKKAAPATAPAIPGFGTPFLSMRSTAVKDKPLPSSNSQPQQKSPSRSLGLTPGTGGPQDPPSDSDEDDAEIDEETLYAELGDKLTFEHNGVVVSLKSHADLRAWKQERQRNWPTKARTLTKDEERRRIGEERRRLLGGVAEPYGAPTPLRPGELVWTSADAKHFEPSEKGMTTLTSDPSASETRLEKAKREIEQKTAHLDELRRRVKESETRNREAREKAEQRQSQHTEEDGTTAPESTDPQTSASAEMTSSGTADSTGHDTAIGLVHYSSSSTLSSVSGSESTSEEDSDEEPPEEKSSKAAAPDNTHATMAAKPPCKYFRISGHCRNADACSYSHDLAGQQQHQPTRQQPGEPRRTHARKDVSAPRLEQQRGRKTIFQRLVEQEEEENDRLALKVVKYLGQAGFFQ